MEEHDLVLHLHNQRCFKLLPLSFGAKNRRPGLVAGLRRPLSGGLSCAWILHVGGGRCPRLGAGRVIDPNALPLASSLKLAAPLHSPLPLPNRPPTHDIDRELGRLILIKPLGLTVLRHREADPPLPDTPRGATTLLRYDINKEGNASGA
ncbi:hypothetical protein NL676_030039 [Syzygium grande]|nr:hypothetical protein NL676_030039 [Syzygium grande]